MIRSTVSRATAVSALALLGWACGGELSAGPDRASEAGSTTAQVELGRSIYRTGRLPDGTPVEAIVAGDVRVEGTQFTCVSCHQRSGLGSVEAWLVAPPVTGWALDRSVATGPRPRPAYGPGDLLTALRDGVDPGGHALQSLMPRYALGEREVAGLEAYLATLSATVSPGVTAEEIHLATVYTPAPESEEMLGLLRLYVDERNRGTRNEAGRARGGPFYRAQHDDSYRRWVLHEWELSGPPDTWFAQLESHARRTPAFALISGWVDGPWQPIHDFCSREEIPAILPNTDCPPPDVDDDYTVYFSEGLFLDVRVLAETFLDEGFATVLALHDGSHRARAAAEALRRELDGECSVDSVAIGATDGAPDILESAPDAVALWLGEADLASLAEESGLLDRSPPLFVSTMPVDGGLARVPASLRGSARVVHAFSLPDLFESRFIRTAAYLRSRKRTIRPGSERLLAQTYFSCKLVGDALMHIKFDHFYRDYFLEGIDHVTTMVPWSAAHPEPTFGPGQRSLSKGCYLLPPGWDGDADSAEWIVP